MNTEAGDRKGRPYKTPSPIKNLRFFKKNKSIADAAIHSLRSNSI